MQHGPASRIFRFAGVTLDGERGCLRGPDGAEVPLAPKPLDLLTLLARNAGRTLSKEVLLDQVWPGVHVTEASLFQAVREARRAIGDERAGLLRSVPRRGYLLDTSVEMVPQTEAQQSRAGATALAPPPDMPSLAVLPFDCSDPSEAGFAEGMVEEITTALSRMHWLFVVARNSAFAAAERSADPRDIGRVLGVRYLMRGSLRRAAGTLRIACHLVEADTLRQIWSERFEGEPSDVFSLQDRVAEAVMGAMMPSLETAEVRRAWAKRTEDLGAWDLVARALPLIRGMTREGTVQAIELLREAIARDAQYGLALGLAAWCGTLEMVQLWARSPGHTAEGLALAERAINAGSDDPDALAMGGYTLGFLHRDPGYGLPAIERALLLNQNVARVHHFAGWMRGFAGEHAQALAHFERAERLSPLDQRSYCIAAGRAFAQLYSGNAEAGAAAARHSLGLNPNFTPAHRALIAALGLVGRREEAEHAIGNALAVTPGLTVSAALAATRFMRAEDRALFREGLLRAGLPS